MLLNVGSGGGAAAAAPSGGAGGAAAGGAAAAEEAPKEEEKKEEGKFNILLLKCNGFLGFESNAYMYVLQRKRNPMRTWDSVFSIRKVVSLSRRLQ